MAKKLAEAHKRFTSIYIHVDDISTLTRERSGPRLVERATAFARDFFKLAEDLKLDISDKTTVVPYNVHTRLFARIANRIGISVKVDKDGVDIGVDTSSAARRATKKQRARVALTTSRATQTAILAKKNHKVRRLALTGFNRHKYSGTLPSEWLRRQ